MKHKRLNLTFYSDPSHAWLKVERATLEALGVADKITSFSYVTRTHAYLEEDIDAGTFITAAEQAGYLLNISERHANRRSRVRNLEPYFVG